MFVQGVAAQSARGKFGDCRIAAGIVGTVDLLLGDEVLAVVEAHLAASPQRCGGMLHGAASPPHRPPSLDPPKGIRTECQDWNPRSLAPRQGCSADASGVR